LHETKQGLRVWQLTLLALGTVIGGSFFLGTSIAINQAGPSVILAFLLGGLLVYLILTAFSEMAVANPTSGAFRVYCEDYLGPMAGFVVGWVYWTGLVLAMSSEAVAVSLFLRAWFEIPLPLLAALVVLTVTLFNLLGSHLFINIESGLAIVKVLAVVGFVVLAFMLIMGLVPDREAVGLGVLPEEQIFPNGLAAFAGSMLIVIFTYAGFETIGFAASEAINPDQTIPRAINWTVISLVSLYTLSLIMLMPLLPTAVLTEEVSPWVAGLVARGLDWAGSIINLVLITATISTMLAAMFALGRMISSLASEGQAPSWLRNVNGGVPRRGIIFSGAGMLSGILLAYLLPEEIYIFLVSSGGFAFLFTYLLIVYTHYIYRRKEGCPAGRCRLPGYPYTSIFTMLFLVVIMITMPLVPGQGAGLFAGLFLVGITLLAYFLKKRLASGARSLNQSKKHYLFNYAKYVSEMEVSDELNNNDR